MLGSLDEIELHREKENKLQRQRTAALQDEINSNLQYREKVLMGSYTPGLNAATDTQLVSSLTDLIRDKNARVEVLEEVLNRSMQRLR